MLGVYPAWLQSHAEDRARRDGCRGDGPPAAGFLDAIADDEKAAAFPFRDGSDVVAAEAAFCVGTYAQACLALERAPDAERRVECERWREFARWYTSTSADAPQLCAPCAALAP